MRSLVLFALIVSAAVGWSQSIVPGTDLATTIKPSELTAEYRPLKLKEQSSGAFGDYYSSSYFQFASLGLRGDDARLQPLLEILPVSWTRNQMAEVYGQKFVVTYIFEPSITTLRAFTEGKPIEGIVLKLKLMKADQIGSIEPFPELDLEKYLKVLDQLGQSGVAAFSGTKKTIALSNAKQVAVAVMILLTDMDDLFPYVQSTASFVKKVEPYVKNGEVWKTHNPRGEGQFRFNMSLAGVSVTDIKEPGKTPMLYDPTPFPDGSHLVAFADSTARYVQAGQWLEVEKNLKLKLKRHGKPIK